MRFNIVFPFSYFIISVQKHHEFLYIDFVSCDITEFIY